MKRTFVLCVLLVATLSAHVRAESGFNFFESSVAVVGTLAGNGSGLTNVPASGSGVLIASTTVTTSTGVVTLGGFSISTSTYGSFYLSFDIQMATGTIPTQYTVYAFINNNLSSSTYSSALLAGLPLGYNYHSFDLVGVMGVLFSRGLLVRSNIYNPYTNGTLALFYNDTHTGVLNYLTSSNIVYLVPVSNVNSITIVAPMVSGLNMISTGSVFSIFAVPL
jgi:hypothetical protein